MPASAHRTFSPPPLSTISSSQGSLSPLQVKKLVLEGRSRQDGASLRMFLKLSVPVENIQPGISVPLFPEDNIRIIKSIVHPLDERSVPFYFNSTEQPLVHRTAVALQLGPKSSRHYNTLFSAIPGEASSSTSRRHSLPQNDRLAARVVVNSYHVTLVMPKEFPTRNGTVITSDGDEISTKEPPSSWSARSSRRSSSIFNKSYFHMMVGLEIFVPYVIGPPKGPFLVSIPLPRCLDNHLKMRIAVKNIVTSDSHRSLDSASSGEEFSGWDFLTEPPVIKKVHKAVLLKSGYTQSGEEDASDSPSVAANSGMEVIQGAFQSTDFLHIQWAPPLGKRPSSLRLDDGMHRVAIPRATSFLRCDLLARDTHSVQLRISYSATCYDLWHPGVAIILGVDIAFDVNGRRTYWPDDENAGWAVTSGDTFAGLHLDGSSGRSQSISRQSSFSSIYSSAFLPDLTKSGDRPMLTPAKGSASLLRAPLPNQNTPDYSFENSPTATPAPNQNEANPPHQESVMSRTDASPGKVVTLKVNIIKLLKQPKNEFSFSVGGVVLMDIEDEDFISMPNFRILGCANTSTSFRIDCQTADTRFYVGEEGSDPSSRRLLQVGEEVRCDEALGIFVNPLNVPSPAPVASAPEGSSPLQRMSPFRNRALARARAGRRDNTAMATPFAQELPLVLCTVMPLVQPGAQRHCVKVSIPIYSLDSDVVEFSLAMAKDPVSKELEFSPAIDVLYATYAGRQAHVEVISKSTSPPVISGTDSTTDSDLVGETQVVVMIYLGEIEADTGAIEINYLISDRDEVTSTTSLKVKGKQKQEVDLDILLPCFQLPCAHYEVQVEYPVEVAPFIKYSSFSHHHYNASMKKMKLTHFRLPSRFFPVLSLSLLPEEDPNISKSKLRVVTKVASKTVLPVILFSLAYLILTIGYEIQEVRHTMQATAQALINGVPYVDTYWGLTDPWHAQTITTSTVTSVITTTSTEDAQEVHTTEPGAVTISLAQATTVPPPKPIRKRISTRDLIPLPAIPLLSWRIPSSVETRKFISQGLVKAWYLICKAWNFPMHD